MGIFSALQTAAKAPFSDSHNPFHCWVLQWSSLISAVAVDLEVLHHRLEHLCVLNNVNPKIKREEGSIWTWSLDTSVCIYVLWCRLAETLNVDATVHWRTQSVFWTGSKCACFMQQCDNKASKLQGRSKQPRRRSSAFPSLCNEIGAGNGSVVSSI